VLWYSIGMDNKLQELIDLCPCPIEFETSGNLGGFYHPRSRTITIAKQLSDEEQFAVLSHEMKHAECHLTNCHCWGSEMYLTEYHAYYAQVLECTDHIPALKLSMDWIRWVVKQTVSWPDHAKAAKRLVRTKLWQKALKLTELS